MTKNNSKKVNNHAAQEADETVQQKQRPPKISNAEAEALVDAIADGQQERKRLQDMTIVQKIEEECLLFRDQYEESYIAPNGDGTKVYKIGAKSREFRAWSASYIRKNFHIVPTLRRIDNIAQMLEGETLDTELCQQYPLEVRTFFREKNLKKNINQDELWYDLGESVVKITADGWHIVAHPPVLFRRFSQQIPQAIPEKGGNLLELSKFVNLHNKDDILLFLVFTVAAFIPGYPRPLCLLWGTMGSGKSTPGRLLKRLIDPTIVEGTDLPTAKEDLLRIASHHAIIIFDNISSISTRISDTLARISTGETFSNRVLFTDDDDFARRIQRPVMLNGINQVISQSDLLDRSILLEMHRIDKSQMRTEKDFWADFEEQKPYILGAIFDTISMTLKTLPNIQLENLPRMADFARIGYAIAENIEGYTGEDFINAYTKNIGDQHDEAIENSAVGLAVFLFMTEDKQVKGKWSGTATQLMRQIEDTGIVSKDDKCPTLLTKELNTITNGSLWPKDPAWFMRRLNCVLPNLEARGITVQTFWGNKRRMINLVNHNYNVNTTEGESNV